MALTRLCFQEKVDMDPALGLDWEEEMATARPHDCVSVPANHPLYVLYTSGTTGTPKVPTSARALVDRVYFRVLARRGRADLNGRDGEIRGRRPAEFKAKT